MGKGMRKLFRRQEYNLEINNVECFRKYKMR